MSAPVDRAGARLIIDLAAIRRNYRRLQTEAGPGVTTAAVVKANAYGLGANQAVPVLAGAGCRDFFTATVDEALAVRALAPAARIFCFVGAPEGTESELAEHRIVPVLNDLATVDRLAAGSPMPVAIHVDTGMARLGMPVSDAEALSAEPERMGNLTPDLVLSHLACADEPGHELNRMQYERFLEISRLWPSVPASLANSSGIFLGPVYCFDLVRAGAALYGINPTPDRPNPMQPVVHLQAKSLRCATLTPL